MRCYHSVHRALPRALFWTHQHLALMRFPLHLSTFFIGHQFLASLCIEDTHMIIWDEISLSPPTMQFCSFLFPIGLSVEKWVCILSWESFINDINGLVNTSYMPGTWQIGPLISFNVILTITLSNSGVPLYGWGAQPLWLAQGHRWFWYIPKFWERPSSPIC